LALESPLDLQEFFKIEEDVYPARVVLFHLTSSPPRIPNRLSKAILATYQIQDNEWKEDIRLPCFGVFKSMNKTAERDYYPIDDPFFKQMFIEAEQKSTLKQPDDDFATGIVVLILAFFLFVCIILCCELRTKSPKPKKSKGPSPELTSVRWNANEDVKHID